MEVIPQKDAASYRAVLAAVFTYKTNIYPAHTDKVDKIQYQQKAPGVLVIKFYTSLC